jgi:two-component system sensor histidine kinase DesK
VAEADRQRPELKERLVGDIAPKTALVIMVTVLVGYTLIGVTYVQSAHPPLWKAATAGILIAMLLVLQVCHSFPRMLPGLARRWPLTLGIQAVITFAPFLFIGKGWLGVPGFLAGSCLLNLSPLAAWSCLAGITVVSDIGWAALGNTVETTWYVTVATLLTALVVYGLSRLVELVREAYDARTKLAQLAVSQERLRFARDLQPLFGRSIAEITCRCEQAHRELRQQPERAVAELTEALLTARQTLTDVRTVASGYKEMSLTAELASAQSILAALDIDAQVTSQFAPEPGAAETVLAVVLRDGLTEVLRHDSARRCVVDIAEAGQAIRLRIATDARLGPRDGFLARLGRQVGEHGGVLGAAPRGDGWFEITAEMPRPD